MEGRMRRFAWITLAGAILVGAMTPSAQSGDNYELDVVVTDRDGKPMMDLQQADFTITEDGKKVEPTSFTKVELKASGTPEDGRTVIIVLDDTAAAVATDPVKVLTGSILQTAKPGDRISISRLSNTADKIAYDATTVGARLNEYKAGAVPFSTGNTTEDFLQLVARLSGELAQPVHRRKAIVCVGAPGVCSLPARQQNAVGQLWANWVNAMTAMAKSNVSLYAFMPIKTTVGDGAVTDESGGTGFSNANDFRPFAERVWSEISNYYLISYAGAPASKDLRSISVKVNKSGARVHARKLRGK
jgi:hypothetical protein